MFAIKYYGLQLYSYNCHAQDIGYVIRQIEITVLDLNMVI